MKNINILRITINVMKNINILRITINVMKNINIFNKHSEIKVRKGF